jgi:16S rRNA A1518/A1519 N6-dimethyltransferase RsmA/KsgA/DIM1 with predicted DNA glycosylase/AP lyase activity
LPSAFSSTGSRVIVGDIKAGAFWPRPDVDSAILRIDLFEEPRCYRWREEKRFSGW